jgi:hypothetical protein
MHRKRLAAGGHFSFAAANGHGGDLAVGIGIDAIAARAQQRHGAVWRIHLVAFVLIQVADRNIDSAIGETQLRHAVIQIQKGDSRVRIHSDGGGTDVQFGMRAVVGPQVIPYG